MNWKDPDGVSRDAECKSARSWRVTIIIPYDIVVERIVGPEKSDDEMCCITAGESAVIHHAKFVKDPLRPDHWDRKTNATLRSSEILLRSTISNMTVQIGRSFVADPAPPNNSSSRIALRLCDKTSR